MPFVGCPLNSTYVSPSVAFHSVWRNYDASGNEIAFADWLTQPQPLESASKYGSGGPRITISDGGKWAPTRAYTRSASVISYDLGSNLMSRPSDGQTLRGSGVWAPNGIWAPAEYHVMGVPSDDFTVDVWGVPDLTAKSIARLNTGLLVKAGDRKVNLGNNLVESGETLKMLCNAVSTVVRAIRFARKGNWTGVARALKHPKLKIPKGRSIGEAWLSFIYGWKPLLQDIYDLYKTLQKGLNLKPQLLSVRRRISTSESMDRSIDSSFTHHYARTTATLYGKMWYRISNDDITILNRLGLINPHEAAWELLPFSFVVDWFVPVSSYLEALSARVGLEFVDGYYGVSINTISLQSKIQTAGFGFEVVESTSTSKRETSGYRRIKMPSLPWPDVWYKSPFSTIHVANALALLSTLRRG